VFDYKTFFSVNNQEVTRYALDLKYTGKNNAPFKGHICFRDLSPMFLAYAWRIRAPISLVRHFMLVSYLPVLRRVYLFVIT